MPPVLNLRIAWAAGRSLVRVIFAGCNAYVDGAEPGTGRRRCRGMELLLAVLLVLMIPGLLTYLVPARRRDTAQD